MKLGEFTSADGVRLVDHQGPVYLVKEVHSGRSDSANNLFEKNVRYTLKRIEGHEVSLNLGMGSTNGDDRVGVLGEYVSAKELWTTASGAVQHMAERMFERAAAIAKSAGGVR